MKFNTLLALVMAVMITAPLLAVGKPNIVLLFADDAGNGDVGARRDQWRICSAYRQKWQLFDLSQDVREADDVSAKHSDLLDEMVAEIQQPSQSHTEPRCFHALAARDEWIQTETPNYEETFRIEKIGE